MKKFMSLVVAIVATVTFGSLVFAGVSSNTYTGFADFSDSGSYSSVSCAVPVVLPIV